MLREVRQPIEFAIIKGIRMIDSADMKAKTRPFPGVVALGGKSLPVDAEQFAGRLGDGFRRATGFALCWICADDAASFTLAETGRSLFCRGCRLPERRQGGCLRKINPLVRPVAGPEGPFMCKRCPGGQLLAVAEVARLCCGRVYLLTGLSPNPADERATGRTVHRLAAFNAHIDLLAFVLPWIRERIQSAALLESPRENRIVRKALALVRDRFTEALSLPEVAGHCGVSASYLSHNLRKDTGKAFRTLLTELRLARVERLLAESPLRITEVCFAAGFQSLSRFNRSFRQKWGRSPRAWRKQYLGMNAGTP